MGSERTTSVMRCHQSIRGLLISFLWAVLLPVRGIEPVMLTTQHVDLRIRYRQEAQPVLDIVATDEDARPARDHAATNCVLLVAEAGRLELPSDIPPLGSAGDSLWILPASQREGMLYLGMSAEGNPLGVFDGPMAMRLLSVEGPGHFFLWQAELGGLRFWMNSRDGFGDDDVFTQSVGGHSHFDWGFSTSGVYRIIFQAEARRLGESTNVVSDPIAFTFHVLPLPPELSSPFQAWQKQHWPEGPGSPLAAPDKDPDGDGLVNLWEYALARSPTTADPGAPPGLTWARTGGGASAAEWSLSMARSKAATDLEFRLERAPDPRGPWVRDSIPAVIEPAVNGVETVRWRISGSPAGGAAGFYRLLAELKDQP